MWRDSFGCTLRDSNPRPSPCKGVALPTELRVRVITVAPSPLGRNLSLQEQYTFAIFARHSRLKISQRSSIPAYAVRRYCILGALALSCPLGRNRTYINGLEVRGSIH